ncbi:hypothetical protein RclHR1_19130004 [Rhizophagus clarus]|uniref:Interferon alpha-inducible protein 27-like protein 1 n=1 Tax=Rhizophagus clarus TaxID=94130 RepID=A0A2Z6RH21_9GLOM|nr:hypothetical protein RclHR1_19130004 [Rhizophagus clarus]GES89894.1 interferon alpha-inducible protein 27-like protein 1 [Rhizophagus clarus]
MPNLSDISDVDKCKGVIIDSLREGNFITRPNEAGGPRNFFNEHKTALVTGGLTVAGLLTGIFAGPAIIGGVVGLLGFGEAGIAAGSIAAWMMSLHRGAVAAGSLVAILQSVGAAGIGIGGIIASGVGGSLFAGAVAKALLKNLESEESLTELNNYVSITDDSNVVIFDMRLPLLINGEILNSFYRGFDSARRITTTKRFEFRANENYVEGIRRHLELTYGTDYVSVVGNRCILNLEENN